MISSNQLSQLVLQLHDLEVVGSNPTQVFTFHTNFQTNKNKKQCELAGTGGRVSQDTGYMFTGWWVQTPLYTLKLYFEERRR